MLSSEDSFQTDSCSWLPPPTEVLKVNFDAALSKNKAAAGYIIRDCRGKIIKADDKTLYTSTVFFAEL